MLAVGFYDIGKMCGSHVSFEDVYLNSVCKKSVENEGCCLEFCLCLERSPPRDEEVLLHYFLVKWFFECVRAIPNGYHIMFDAIL